MILTLARLVRAGMPDARATAWCAGLQAQGVAAAGAWLAGFAPTRGRIQKSCVSFVTCARCEMPWRLSG